ncbi:MAG TPA: polysaccharide pyruvyl transferase family protein [Flavobacteriales bacterium]|nr:polysaccharide pyruvyl transferase family protein [Flavobacteriales bacterium]
MVLKYHKGRNFGDALNPLIFNHYLPDFFDQDKSTGFYGIGSILGFVDQHETKKIIFSSGFAHGNVSTYGQKPIIDETYDVICVRGPLTAKLLELSPKVAVSDGALLLNEMVKPLREKKYFCSFIPHVGSLSFYSEWQSLLESLNIHFIDPSNEPESVIHDIQASQFVIAEAMHGAIVADALRVPWIPVKLYKTINDFKWKDYLQSVELPYSPTIIKGIYKKEALRNMFDQKLKITRGVINKGFAGSYKLYQDLTVKKKLYQSFKRIVSEQNTFLSADAIMQARVGELKGKIEEVKRKYRV